MLFSFEADGVFMASDHLPELAFTTASRQPWTVTSTESQPIVTFWEVALRKKQE